MSEVFVFLQCNSLQLDTMVEETQEHGAEKHVMNTFIRVCLCVCVVRHDRHEDQGTEIHRGQDGEWKGDLASSFEGRSYRSGSGEVHTLCRTMTT